MLVTFVSNIVCTLLECLLFRMSELLSTWFSRLNSGVSVPIPTKHSAIKKEYYWLFITKKLPIKEGETCCFFSYLKSVGW